MTIAIGLLLNFLMVWIILKAPKNKKKIGVGKIEAGKVGTGFTGIRVQQMSRTYTSVHAQNLLSEKVITKALLALLLL